MTDIRFDRLQDLPPREAWAHEALAFTPWLAANIDHLSDAIGIPLELTGQEVRVETFAADILARNPQDDSVVLIENQLEATDHTHLGQIMTYLAGLQAQTVVWIAPAFREPHLSAIRWLNEHTAEGFSFFAVRLRVVRIADSPYAPIFEVIEKPNDWERELTVKRRAATGDSERGDRRRAFWEAYLARHAEAAAAGVAVSRLATSWVPIEGPAQKAYLSLWLGKEDSGAFLRGDRGSDGALLMAELEPHAAELERRLGATFEGSNGHFLWKRAGIPFDDRERWVELIDWMETTRADYARVLRDVLGAPS